MTAEFKFPNEIDPLGSNLNRELDFQRLPQAKQKQISVRIGEILRGKIIEVISPQQAVISLPDGTFTAEISGKFKTGDELFFRVQSTEPSLVLKIHSTFVTYGNKVLATNEILRLLDLPNTQLFSKIIDFLKANKNIIIRDEVILQSKYLNTLLENNPKDDIEVLLKFLELTQEINVEPENKLYQHYKNIFKFNAILPKILAFLQTYAGTTSEEIKRKVQNINEILKSESSLLSLIKILSPNFAQNEDNFFNLIIKYQNTELAPELSTSLSELREFFNSFWVLNSISALSTRTHIFFIIPYIWEKNLRFTIFRYRKKKFGRQETTRLEAEDEELIKPVSESIEKEFGNYLSSNEGRTQLNLMLNTFRKYSKKLGQKVQVKTPFNLVEEYNLIQSFQEGQSGVSIVI